ncbi:MAG: hypothetical protein ACT4PZ_14180 [Panacagrimonas sp.]
MLLRPNPKLIVRTFKLSVPKDVSDRLDNVTEQAAAFDISAEVERALTDSLIRMLNRAEKELKKISSAGSSPS